MEREDEVHSDGSLQLVNNMDDHDTENKKPKREAAASSSSYLDSYEYLCSQVSETPVLTEKRLHHNHAMSCHLCEDLIDEIFIRLPLKSLGRNRSLSKSWHSRISTPSFIRKHTLRSVTAPLPPQKYFLRNNIRYDSNCMGFSTKCILLEKRYTSLLPVKPIVGLRFKIVGSCNGIICLFNTVVKSITLWNPSIRRKLTVPAYPSSNKWLSFGFGFDPIRNDYRIVAISYSYFKAAQSFIYSMKRNYWKKIVSPTPNVNDMPFTNSSSCFFNGKLHWVVNCELNDINQCCIITFDLSTNVFGFISLPKPDLVYYAPMIIKGCLAVILKRRGGNHCSIWVMREYNNVASWTKAFDILEGILMNEDHKDSVWYNNETGTRSRLIVDSYYTVDTDMCIESLELLDKEEVIDDAYFLERCY